MKYKCVTCGETHDDLPAYGSAMPAQYWDVPQNRIECDVFLTTDSCVILDRFFYIRGCIEIPVIGLKDPWVLGAWVSLKEDNFMKWQECYYEKNRKNVGPFFGWLCSDIPCYTETVQLKTMAHLQDDGIRPRIILEPSKHQLSIDQQNGVSLNYAWEMIHIIEEKSKKVS